MLESRLFGTDGIRDIAGQGNLTPEQIVRTGKAIGYLVGTEPALFSDLQGGKTPPGACVVLARDTRASGHMIEGAICAGLLASGIDIVRTGVLPTPVCSFLVKELECAVGIVISASHNPYQYNGIKLFDSRGFKISSVFEDRIEELVRDTDRVDSISSDQIGMVDESGDPASFYIDDTVARVIDTLDLRDMKIIIDCAHGAVTEIAPAIFSNLGAETNCINAEPDGLNINVNSGAMYPALTSEAVKGFGADIGFSFDGDGDRVILVDENGTERDGDYIMAICGRYLKEKSRLGANTVVTTVMANLGLELSLRERQIELVRTKVGDRFVTEELVRLGATLGGEQSGHILFLDKAPTGDGIWTTLMILQVMSDTGKSLSELSTCMKKCPQVLLNVEVQSKPPLESVPEVKAALEEAYAKLGEEGRVVLRYSGTEPLARVMLEGPDNEVIQELAEKIARAIRDVLG